MYRWRPASRRATCFTGFTDSGTWVPIRSRSARNRVIASRQSGAGSSQPPTACTRDVSGTQVENSAARGGAPAGTSAHGTPSRSQARARAPPVVIAARAVPRSPASR